MIVEVGVEPIKDKSFLCSLKIANLQSENHKNSSLTRIYGWIQYVIRYVFLFIFLTYQSWEVYFPIVMNKLLYYTADAISTTKFIKYTKLSTTSGIQKYLFHWETFGY